jgi:hypothetical protein
LRDGGKETEGPVTGKETKEKRQKGRDKSEGTEGKRWRGKTEGRDI